MAYRQNPREFSGFKSSAAEADKEQEKRDELETMKVHYFLRCVQLA